MDRAALAALVDHTLLRPEASAEDVRRLCAEAAVLGCATACVHGRFVALAARELAGSAVGVCGVAGFPLGAGSTAARVAECAGLVADGADEVDVVVALGPLLAGDDGAVRDDLAAVRAAVPGAVLKVILETAALPADALARGCALAEAAGADHVKTSTGFHPAGGATVDAVRALRAAVGDRLGVKASGGIRDLPTLRAMVDAGASRVGMSATVSVLGG